MPLFEWSDMFSVNVKEMDEQHKKLIGILNFFHDEKLAKRDEKALGKVLDDLIDYTKTHFKREEELMEQYEYPEYTVQKSEHDSLVLKVEVMQKRYYTGNTSIATDVAILLNDWLAEHIMIEDKKYGVHFNSKGIT